MNGRRTHHFRFRSPAGWTLAALLAALSLSGIVVAALQQKSDKPARSRPPKFTDTDTRGVFFDDVFSTLDGNRPSSFQVAPPTAVARTEPGGGGGKSGSGAKWSETISAVSLEDEVKAAKLELSKSVTTPTAFRGQGHEVARQSFMMLTLAFYIIEDYDGDVRWKRQATAAKQQFASVAGNAKAGGNEQVYTQAKRCKEMLEQLLRGEQLGVEATDAEDDWAPVTPRPPLMTLLEERFEVNLKAWTSSENEFDDNIEDLLREAELVGAISKFLLLPGMDDGEDEEYREFCQMLGSGAKDLARGVKNGDLERAQAGVSQVSQSCNACHDVYR